MFKKTTMIMIMILALASPAISQQVSDKTVKVSWDVMGVEQDIGRYQLYVSNTGEAGSFGPAGDPIIFNPLDPDAPARLETDYTFSAPAGEETTRWFTVTATDNSGNESGPSEAVTVTVDQKPPEPPTGFRVEVLIKVTQ